MTSEHAPHASAVNASVPGEPEVSVCIGLGGNLGNVATTIQYAFAALHALPETRVLRRSRLYRTPAWGMTAQPDFINAAAVLGTRLSAEVLLEELLRIEREAGRDRDAQSERWGPRALDLDLLLYGDAVIAHPHPGLCVPHPRLHERAFVLVPLAEIAPGALVPGHGRVDALLATADTQGIRVLG
jgi:2-amino-4-hydroxy-6-hydroxymethyldihydropteridine diphosphokinase